MNQGDIDKASQRLVNALESREPIAPLTDSFPEISIENAYEIARVSIEHRQRRGAKLIGKKIGVTSAVVQRALGVHQPDFGFLTDDMVFSSGDTVPLSDTLIQPRAEGEIAFCMSDGLSGPGVTSMDVLRATEFVIPCIEIIDSRIRDWKIKIQDTIADNASCGVFVLGGTVQKPTDLDLSTCGVVMRKNGELVGTGAGAEALGSPLNSVAWLVNTLAKFSIQLNPGDIVLSGSLVPLVDVSAGDSIACRFSQLGYVELKFS